MTSPYEQYVKASTGPSSLVGRANEQRQLRDDLNAACDGRGGIVVLSGDAGIGKTALARELADFAMAQDLIVLTGHCYDLTVTPPYGPWLNLAASYRPTFEMPELPTVLASGRIEEIENQSALFAEIRAFLADIASVRPVVLVLEDMHWADSTSLELLRSIGTSLTSLSVLMVVIYRRSDLTSELPFYQQLPALIRETNGRRLDLLPLTIDDLNTLVDTRVPMVLPDRDRLVSYLDRHAEGNPFFVVELLRALQEEGLVRSGATQWEVGELDRVVMPSLVRQVIETRVARLGTDLREPLALASVIGQVVPLNLWASVLGLDEDHLMEIVDQAMSAHLFEATPDGSGVRFVHALTREALYEGVIVPRRRRWHLQVGELLSTDSNTNPDAVAFHFERAGDARAWEWYVRAGERAQRAYAWLMAKERFLTAADLLDGVSGLEERRGQLLYRCGRLQRYSDTTAGIANLAAAERVAYFAGHRVLAADAKYSRGLLRCFADDFGPGLVEMESGIIELEQLPADEAQASWGRAMWMADALPYRDVADIPEIDPAARELMRAGIHHRRGSFPWFLAAAGHLTRAKQMAEEFVALAEGVPAGELVVSASGHACFGLGLAHAALGHPDEARRSFARAREIYNLIDHHAVIGFTHLSELRDVVIPYYASQIADRERISAAAEAALNRAAGAFPSERSSRGARLGLLFLGGHWNEACEIANEVGFHGNYVLRREMTNALAPIWYWQGQVDLLMALIRQYLPHGAAAEPGTIVLLDGLLLQRLAADLAMDRGDLSAALAWLEANDRWLAWSGSVLGRAENQLSWSRHCLLSGDLNRAIEHADKALAAASDPEQPLVLIAAHRMRAELAIGTGDLNEAHQDLDRALAIADLCAAPFPQALTLIARAEWNLASHQVDLAETDLTEAYAILQPLGAKEPLSAVAAIRQRAADAKLSAPGGLSPREVDVLRLVASGLSDIEVANQLFISPRTVGQHLRSIYNKLGVSSRVAATRFAIDRGIV